MSTGFLFVCGLALLIAGAEILVRGATRLAVGLGVSPLLVGLTVVAYATGAPELAVSIQAARSGQPDIALGNVIGSNIFNVLFILGVSATILPLAVSRRLVRFEVPLMLGVSGLLYMLARDGHVTLLDGMFLFGGSLLYTLIIVFQARRESVNTGHTGKEEREEEKFTQTRAAGRGGLLLDLILIAVGLAMLILGARWLVAGAVAFAKFMGISESIIALTIIAVGTGLPEVATSIIAGLRGQRDIAIGNVVGSNIFNILAVLGFSAMVSRGGAGLPVSSAMIQFDLLIMTGAALACLPIVFNGYKIERWEGLVLLSYYFAYTTFLVLKETNSTALPHFQTAMVGFFLPVTAITLFVITARSISKGRRVRVV